MPGGSDFAEEDLPQEQVQFIALNAELAKQWKPIVAKKDAPADADKWRGLKDKLRFLER